jgi:hypothetical protein
MPPLGQAVAPELGHYSDTGLKDARDKRDAARRLLAAGTDPGEHRKAAKAAGSEQASNTLEIVAREWHAKQTTVWSVVHRANVMRRFEHDVFPWLGSQPIARIIAPELLATLRRLASRGTVESAHRALQNCGQLFRYAIATGRAERDPSSDLRGALSPVKETHHNLC